MENFSSQFKGRGEMSKIVKMEQIVREGFMKERCSPGNWTFCLGRKGWKFQQQRIKRKKVKEIQKRTQLTSIRMLS